MGSNREICCVFFLFVRSVLLTSAFVVGVSSVRLEIRSSRWRNSNSVKIFFSSSSSGCFVSSSSIFNSIGTSILIVARYFEKRICSLFSSTFFFKAPFSSSVCANKFSMESNVSSNFWAVFSPTPGHPGILSEESPIKPSRSMTCSVRWILYFSLISSVPSISNPLSPCCGRYMKTCSFTSCA